MTIQINGSTHLADQLAGAASTADRPDRFRLNQHIRPARLEEAS